MYVNRFLKNINTTTKHKFFSLFYIEQFISLWKCNQLYQYSIIVVVVVVVDAAIVVVVFAAVIGDVVVEAGAIGDVVVEAGATYGSPGHHDIEAGDVRGSTDSLLHHGA